MCGIFFYLKFNHATQNKQQKDFEQLLLPLVERRGPDDSSAYSATVTNEHGTTITLSFFGAVLHLRGDLTRQPQVSNGGDVLLWNGEIFGGGIQVSPEENDTHILFKRLTGRSQTDSSTDNNWSEITEIFSSIEGPWACVYLNVSAKTLWFGRDYLGRRSLIKTNNADSIAITSVACKDITDQDFTEIPAKFLYSIDLNALDLSSGTIEEFIKSHPLKPPLLVHDNRLGVVHRCQRKAFSSLETVVCSSGDNQVSSGDKQGACGDKQGACGDKQGACGDKHGFCGGIQSCSTDVPSTREDNQSSYGDNVKSSHESNKKCDTDYKFLDDRDKDSSGYGKRSNTKCSANENRLPSYLHETCSINDGEKAMAYESHCEVDNDSHCSQTDDATTPKLNEGRNSEHKMLTQQDAHSVFLKVLQKSVRTRVNNIPRNCANESNIGILFSGGIDSVVLAVLADRCLPEEESIDLINVAFEQKYKVPQNTKKKNIKPPDRVVESKSFDVPDRLTGKSAMKELNSKRKWNFIEVDVTLEELQTERKSRISNLVYPLTTVLDDSIGCAIWFAARGVGKLYKSTNGELELLDGNYRSPVKVLLTGMGADEQLGGYARHRTKYESQGWKGLREEMQMELDRISSRNLGRDDRCISDHGREARFPFLDENVVSFLKSLPVCVKCDPRLPRGVGEKILLREVAAMHLCLKTTSRYPKRAIQFGSRIAKLESSKEKGAQSCDRLK